MQRRKGWNRFQKKKRIRNRNPHAVALGKKGGTKGGPARAAVLSPEQRTAIARQGGYAKSKGT